MSGLSFACRHAYPGGFTLDLAFNTDRPVTALFGPSGSGKTSALETIAGLRRPDAGRITIGDRAVLDTAAGIDLPPERRRVGMVFQDHLLFPHLTVEDNLRFGERRGAGRIAFGRAVEVLELGALLRRPPRGLSGGERQRVALGRALLSGPDLLLLDEPLTALDDALKLRVLACVERVVAEWRIPALFVSHGQAEVRRLAQWVVVVEGGRVIGQGTPDEALAAPGPLAWKDAIGPMNLVRLEEVRVADGRPQGRIGDQWLTLPSPATSGARERFVKFPPEAVILAAGDSTDRSLGGLSARNRLRATLLRAVEVADAVFVELDAGQPFWAVVTREAARELHLTTGAEVTCIIKTQSLRLVE